MRQPTTAEVRLDEHKSASFGPAGPSILPFWLSTSRLRSNFVAAERPRDGRSRPTTSVSGKCRMNVAVHVEFMRALGKLSAQDRKVTEDMMLRIQSGGITPGMR